MTDHEPKNDLIDMIMNERLVAAEELIRESLQTKIHESLISRKEVVAENLAANVEEEKKDYDTFFKSAMKKFGISSPADLKTDEKKKEFFDYVDKNFKATNESYSGVEEEFRFRNPYMPVSTPADYDPRPVGGRPGPKITRDPIGFPPDFPYDPRPVGGRPGPKIVPNPGFPGVPPGNTPVDGVEAEIGTPRFIPSPFSPRGPINTDPTYDPYELREPIDLPNENPPSRPSRFRNPYMPVSTPDDAPLGSPSNPLTPSTSPGINDPVDPNDPSVPVGPGGLPGGYPGPKITRDPLRPNFPGIEGEMPQMDPMMMKKMMQKMMQQQGGMGGMPPMMNSPKKKI